MRRFPPRQRARFHQDLLDELLEERVELRRGHRNLRAVKRKVGKFPIKPARRAAIQDRLDPDRHAYIRILK
jgi:hypothetical protein